MSTTNRMSQVAGKVKEITGRMIGNRTLSAKGITQQWKAKTRIALKRAAHRAGDAVRHIAGRYAHR